MTVEPLNETMRASLKDKATPALLDRWAAGTKPVDRKIEGRLVLETARNGDVLPWVVCHERAYLGSPIGPDHSVDMALQGKPVSVTGTMVDETFSGPVVPMPRETIQACAILHVPTGRVHSGKFIHSDVMDQFAAKLGKNLEDLGDVFESGYATSLRAFVDRAEAARITTDGHPEQVENCLRSEHMPDNLVCASEPDPVDGVYSSRPFRVKFG